MDIIKSIIASAKEEMEQANLLHVLLQDIKPKYFGKDSLLSKLSNDIRKVSPEEKKEIGLQLRHLKTGLTEIMDNAISRLEKEEIDRKLKKDKIDVSLSLSQSARGSLHPLSLVAKNILNIFKKYGCKVCLDSEIGTVSENFDLLNVTADHPARQMHDTFYLNGFHKETGEHYLLRTHTTGADIKLMKEDGVPMRNIAFGKVFRRDLDSTHSPMFHQCDLLMVDKGLNLGNLKFILTLFLKDFFETEEIELRMRPSFFPFTEPSVEIDVRYSVKDNKIVLDKKGDKYMEILGCGVLKPIVLKNCDIDPEVYTGIAAGIGLERLAMLKYGFNDIRDFFKNNIHWLEQAQDIVMFGQI